MAEFGDVLAGIFVIDFIILGTLTVREMNKVRSKQDERSSKWIKVEDWIGEYL